MKDGGERTPVRAAQPSIGVRLAAFAASAALMALVLLAAALWRYPLTITSDRTTATALIVAEQPRPTPAERPRAPNPPLREEPREVLEEAGAIAAPPTAVAASEPPLITAPVWIQRPRNTARFYPRDAFMQGIEGQVVLDCTVEVSGRLDCAITSETPPEKGFGAAALAIAAAHMMQPATQGGVPVRARYRMIVPFTTRG